MRMASCSLHYFFLLSLLSLFSVSCFSAISNEPKPIILPISKDSKTNLFYTTSLAIGQNPIHKMKLTIDLCGPALWHQCNSDYNSSSYRPILCDDPPCPETFSCSQDSCYGDFRPGCTNHTCHLYIINPLASYNYDGYMGTDVTFIHNTKVSNLKSGCFENSDGLLEGLPEQSKGIIGLGRGQFSLSYQLSDYTKFSICLPSSNSKTNNGKIIFGSKVPPSLSQFLLTTPLINPVSTEPFYYEEESSYGYFIQVVSIKIDGKVVNFNHSLLTLDEKGSGGTMISTMQNFTRLHSNIFKPLVRDFVKKASDRKIKKVKSVAPFEACFDEQSIGKTSKGMLDVPIVELKVKGGVGWRIYGSNSMVKVKKNVVCLGFVDGGKQPKGASNATAIVIGGRQLEDNLLVFDQDASKLSFSSSLLVHDASCSSLKV